jgi:hypothetical protein
LNEQKSKKLRTHPVNYVLLGISLIVFGSLGIVFITQMELQPGWVWEDISGENSMELFVITADDLNKDGFSDVIAYTDITRQDSENIGNPNDLTNYGKICGINGLNGLKLWEQSYNNPVKRVIELTDINGDGINDYLADIASVTPEWVRPQPLDNPRPAIILDAYTNIIISGNNGSDIPILTGDLRSFTNFFIHDAVYLEESKADLVFIECKSISNETNEFSYNISSYFVNGTHYDTLNIDFTGMSEKAIIPALDLFPYGSKNELLFIDTDSIILFNTSISNFMNPIYNETVIGYNADYTYIEDLNGDDIFEIALMTLEGNVTLISGIDGSIIRMFNMPSEWDRFDINQLGSDESDMEAYILINCDNYDSRDSLMIIYAVTETSEVIYWTLSAFSSEDTRKAYTLGEDMDGDSLDEIILPEKIQLDYATAEVRRFSIVSTPDSSVLSIINSEYNINNMFPLQDLNGDGKSDYIFSIYGGVAAFASSKPVSIWLSPHFSFGIPLFAILVALLCVGILLVILKGRKISLSRGGVKEHKLTVAVNALAITLISVTFLLFLIQLNIFNKTLIPNQNMTQIIVSFLVVIITWYGALPLTAALYNRFAPRFAFTFVKIRSLFFKVSKSYNTDILVLDMKDRKEIGTVIQMKRVLLPLLLSIAIGFYTYGALTPILGYPQDFEVFGSTEFFQFMNGYMLCCIFPMILTFLVFSFFISGNFLLDDAGIVYFRQSKKYRQPGDIEPISVWAQSLVKGMAGMSAIVTLIGFLTTVDLSGFFADTANVTSWIFGVLVIVVFFAGIPFLTAFSYILLAGEIMEFSMDFNTQKLYSLMEKKGYDTTPHDVTNIYPDGKPASQESNIED